MKTIFQTPIQTQDYLFVPSNPAANGRLHLGHISGPYLSADIVARHRRRQGHSTATIFGIDAYNSYVVRRAEIEVSHPAEVATENHSLIKEDLQAMNILHDVFTNPLDPEWCDHYEQKHREIFAVLEAKGVIRLIDEYSPYSERENRFLPDYAVSGTCPECGAGMGGFSCEGCGGYFYPDAILNQVSVAGETVKFRPVRQICLNTSNIPLTLSDFDRYHFSESVRLIIQKHIEKQDGWFKLTHHFDWGIDIDLGGEKRAIASFMTEYIYNLMHGDLYASLTGKQENPYRKSSSVKIICSFGIDNVLAQAFGKNLIAKVLDDYKADDGFLINYFFNLEGQKFSTSRRHVIWASDIVTKTPANSDGVRLYLSLNQPDVPDKNFDIEAFLSLYNRILVEQLNPKLTLAFAALRSVTSPLDYQFEDTMNMLISAIADFYIQQDQAISDNHLHATAIAEQLLEWIQYPANIEDSPTAAYWWLKGLALLGYPIMPELTSCIWSQLATSKIPLVTEFLDDCCLSLNEQPFEQFQTLTRSSIAQCLPHTLQTV